MFSFARKEDLRPPNSKDLETWAIFGETRDIHNASYNIERRQIQTWSPSCRRRKAWTWELIGRAVLSNKPVCLLWHPKCQVTQPCGHAVCTCAAAGWAEGGLESGKLSDCSTPCTEENLHSGEQEPEVTPLHSVPLPSRTPEMQEEKCGYYIQESRIRCCFQTLIRPSSEKTLKIKKESQTYKLNKAQEIRVVFFFLIKEDRL